MTNYAQSLKIKAAAELELRRRSQQSIGVPPEVLRARTNLLDFTQYTYPEYEANWHHVVICRYLDNFVRGEIKRLMLFVPPQNGKSELVSRRLPAFIFGVNPDAAIIASSYSADLSSRMNRDVQRIIDSPEYTRLFPGTQLYGSNVRTTARGTYLRNSDIFEIVGHKGVYRSAGVGGGITGMGFDFGIIDDPLKDRAEAQSATVRENIWDWYTSTFYTRQRKDAAILLTMTRWHVDDLAGRLIGNMRDPDGEQWVVINFPAIAEEPRHVDDPRAVGEALWPSRYSLEYLDKARRQGEYDFNALYQQRPMAEGGGLFKRDKFNKIDTEPANIVRRVRFWDLAVSSRTSADFSVGVQMGLTADGRYVILDIARFQADWDDVVPKVEAVALRDGRETLIGIETAFFHTQAVKKLLQRPAMHGFSVRGYPVDKDKFTRALPFAARVGEDMVDVLRRSWLDNYLDEITSFTGLGDVHDDQVDASSGAYTMLGERRALEVSKSRFA